MKVVTCYKWVLNETDIRVDEKSRNLDVEKSKAQINEYDRAGLEAGVQIKATTGAELIGITCGTTTEASGKDALSRGIDMAYYLDHPELVNADSGVTSKVLAAMIKHLQGVDAVICSEGSSDDYAQQVGPRIAALLNIPSISYVSKIQVTGDLFKLERKLDDGIETVEIKAPVVISIVPDIGEAPIPGVKQILGAKKKPCNPLSLDAIGLSPDTLKPQLAVASVKAPVLSRKSIRMNPEGTDIQTAAANLVKQLTADGVL